MDKGRAFAIVVWGATGYTGTLISEYLAKNAPETIRWAIAGRNKEKLEKIKDQLLKISPRSKDVSVLIGESGDQASVDAIVKQTRVVLNAAGPYTLYGTPLVDACVRLGTDHVDLTGETSWIKKITDTYHEQAKRNGTFIVNSCGFDSIPNDIGTLVVEDYVKKKYGCECESVKCILTKFDGGASGGSIASAFAIAESITSQTELSNPYCLVPPETKPTVKQPKDILLPYYDSDVKVWRHIYPLGYGETRFVHRSQALLGYAYGTPKLSVSAGNKSFPRALLYTFFLFIGYILIRFKIARWAISKLLPPGSGPKRADLPKGGFDLVVVAEPKARWSVDTVFLHGNCPRRPPAQRWDPV